MAQQFFVSFYPDEEAQGGALRQTLLSESNLNRTIKRAKALGQKLKAKSFVLFTALPRIYLTDYAEND